MPGAAHVLTTKGLQAAWSLCGCSQTNRPELREATAAVCGMQAEVPWRPPNLVWRDHPDTHSFHKHVLGVHIMPSDGECWIHGMKWTHTETPKLPHMTAGLVRLGRLVILCFSLTSLPHIQLPQDHLFIDFSLPCWSVFGTSVGHSLTALPVTVNLTGSPGRQASGYVCEGFF